MRLSVLLPWSHSGSRYEPADSSVNSGCKRWRFLIRVNNPGFIFAFPVRQRSNWVNIGANSAVGKNYPKILFTLNSYIIRTFYHRWCCESSCYFLYSSAYLLVDVENNTKCIFTILKTIEKNFYDFSSIPQKGHDSVWLG